MIIYIIKILKRYSFSAYRFLQLIYFSFIIKTTSQNFDYLESEIINIFKENIKVKQSFIRREDTYIFNFIIPNSKIKVIINELNKTLKIFKNTQNSIKIMKCIFAETKSSLLETKHNEYPNIETLTSVKFLRDFFYDDIQSQFNYFDDVNTKININFDSNHIQTQYYKTNNFCKDFFVKNGDRLPDIIMLKDNSCVINEILNSEFEKINDKITAIIKLSARNLTNTNTVGLKHNFFIRFLNSLRSFNDIIFILRILNMDFYTAKKYINHFLERFETKKDFCSDNHYFLDRLKIQSILSYLDYRITSENWYGMKSSIKGQIYERMLCQKTSYFICALNIRDNERLIEYLLSFSKNNSCKTNDNKIIFSCDYGIFKNIYINKNSNFFKLKEHELLNVNFLYGIKSLDIETKQIGLNSVVITKGIITIFFYLHDIDYAKLRFMEKNLDLSFCLYNKQSYTIARIISTNNRTSHYFFVFIPIIPNPNSDLTQIINLHNILKVIEKQIISIFKKNDFESKNKGIFICSNDNKDQIKFDYSFDSVKNYKSKLNFNFDEYNSYNFLLLRNFDINLNKNNQNWVRWKITNKRILFCSFSQLDIHDTKRTIYNSNVQRERNLVIIPRRIRLILGRYDSVVEIIIYYTNFKPKEFF